MQYWTSEEISLLQDNLQLSTLEIFNKYRECFGNNRSYDSVQKQIRKLRVTFSASDPPLGMDELNALLEELPPSIEIQPPKSLSTWLEEVVKASPGQDCSNPEVISQDSSIVILLTDVHFGKLTDTFNIEICRQRLLSIPDTLALRPLPKFDEIVVVLAGDLVEGEDIFPTQNGAIEAPAIIQLKAAAETFWELIVALRVRFKVTVRVETSPGNHGRTSKTADKRTNWDNVIYQILGMLAKLHGDPEIRVNVNLEWFREFTVKGRKGLAYHYGVKHTGTPAMRERVANWIIMKKIDFMVKGHHHKWEINTHMGRPIISNGSVCGGDEYSEELAQDEPPRQAWFVVTPGLPIGPFGYFEWKNEETEETSTNQETSPSGDN